MKGKNGAFFDRFLAFLIILSVTFTQVCPAFALRTMGIENDTVQRAVRTGLEEADGIDLQDPVFSPDEIQWRIREATREANVERGDCGCFAHVGKAETEGGISTNELLYKVVKALEPRGYQSASAGVVTLGDSPSFDVRKVLGAGDELKRVLDGNPLPPARVKLVHLRWPTQGEASEDNQHPTIQEEGQHTPSDVELIFNGDIINFQEIDEFLASQGIRRPSNVQTDAWTVGALIRFYFLRPSVSQIAERAQGVYERNGGQPGRDVKNWDEAEAELRAENVHMNLLEAVGLAYGRLEGDFALIATSELEPDKAIGALKGQKPLIVGRGRTPEIGTFIGSEASTFIDYTDLNQPLKSGDIVVVTESDAKFYRRVEGAVAGRFSLQEIPQDERPVTPLDVEEVKVSKEHKGRTYEYYTTKEIAQQPDAIQDTLNFQGRADAMAEILQGNDEPMPGLNLSVEEWRGLRGMIVVAMGTATHAAEVSKNFLRQDLSSAERPFSVAVETGTTLYDELRSRILQLLRRKNLAATLPGDVEGLKKLVEGHPQELAVLRREYEGLIGVAVSQSGNTMDTNQTVILLRALGMRFIGIVNKPIETPLVRLTQEDGGLFRTKAGAEVGVASTKAFVAQMTALRMLSIYGGFVRGALSVDEARQKMADLQALPAIVEQFLGDQRTLGAIQRIARKLATQQTLMFLSRGSQVALSKEGALKMLELAYLGTFGMDMALMKHGFIALFPESRDPLVRRYAVASLTDRTSLKEALVNMSEIRARYGNVVAIAFKSDFERVRQNADELILIPDVSDELAAIVGVLPLQLLAVETTKAINEVGEKVSNWAEDLYWKLRERESGTANVSDEDLLGTLRQVNRGYGEFSENHQLDLLPTVKVRQVRLMLEKAVAAGETQQWDFMEDQIREIIQVMRGPRLSMIMFFDHELARFSGGEVAEGKTVLTSREHQQVRDLFARHPITAGSSRTEVLATLSNALAVLYSQAAGRGSPMKARWKDWRFNKGMGEFLSRDLDKPRGLAKEVTVDRLELELRNELGEMGLSAPVLDRAFQGTQALVGERITEYSGVVPMVARLTGESQATVRRRAMMHEQAHFLLRQTPRYGDLLSAANTFLDAAELRGLDESGLGYVSFRDRFETAFGSFDTDAQYADEVLAKYISARLTGVGMELFEPVRPELEEFLAGTQLRWTPQAQQSLAPLLNVSADQLAKPGQLPESLAQLFDPAFLPAYGGRISFGNREVAKARHLSAYASALGMDRAIRREAADQVNDAITRLLRQLDHATVAELTESVHLELAGLEEFDSAEMDPSAVLGLVRFGLSMTYSESDRKSDRAVLDPLRSVLEKSGGVFNVRQGDSTGLSWGISQPTGSLIRRYFELGRPSDSAQLTLAPAHLNIPGGSQRGIISSLILPGGVRRFWFFPADSTLVDQVTALAQSFVEGSLAESPLQAAGLKADLPDAAFRSEVETMLAPEHLSPDQVGSVTARIMRGYAEFRVGRVPQVFSVRHPAEDPDHWILAIVHEDLSRLLEPHVMETVRHPAGADSRKLVGETLQDAGLLILDVQNLPALRMDHVIRKIQKALTAENAPDEFLKIFEPFAEQLPGSPIRESIYPEFLLVLEGAAVRPIESDYVPHRDHQAAVALIFREADFPEEQVLDAGIRSAISQRGLSIANSDTTGQPMWFSVAYQGVRFMRYILEVPETTSREPILDPRYRDVVADIEKLVNGAGLEELVEGTHYQRNGVNGVTFLQPVEITKEVELPSGVTIDPKGATVVIGPGTTLLKGVTLEGTIVIGRGAEVAGIIQIGTPEWPLVIGDGARILRGANAKRSVIGPQAHISGAEISDSTVVSFVRGESVETPRVDSGSHVLNGSVVFGGLVGTGVKIYDHHVVGPFVAYKNNSEHDEGLSWGATSKTPVNFPHQGYTETAWAVSVSPEGLPKSGDFYDKPFYDKLLQILRAINFGKLVKTELNEPAPVSSSGAEFMLTFELDGQTVTFPAQRINFGGGTINSDYSPPTGGRASGIYYGGFASGVNAVPQYPAIFGSRSLLATLSQFGGQIEPGTLAMGSYDMRGEADLTTGNVEVSKVEIPGYRALEKGFTLQDDIAEKSQVQMEYFRHLGVTAQVLAEGARRASDPYTMIGYANSLRAIQGAFSGIGPRYSKVLAGGLDLSLENLRGQVGQETEKIAQAQDDTVRQEHEDRRTRLSARIKKQEVLLNDRDQMVAEIAQIEVAIEKAVNDVALATQVALAEAVRQQVLQPGSTWVNPLAGLEEVFEQGLTLEQVVARIPQIVAGDSEIREVTFNTFQAGLKVERFPTSDAERLDLNITGSSRLVSNYSPDGKLDLRVSPRTVEDGKELEVTPHFASTPVAVGLEETLSRDPLGVLLGYKYLAAPPSYASIQDPRQYWLDIMRGQGIRDVSTLRAFFVDKVPFGVLTLSEQQRLIDLINSSGAKVAQQLQAGLWSFQIPAAALSPNTVTIVDLTLDENGRPNPAAALIVPSLPPGTVAIVRSMDDVLIAEQLAGHPVVTGVGVAEMGDGGLAQGLLNALGAIPEVTGEIQVRILSARSEADIRAAWDSLGGVAIGLQSVQGGMALATLLEALGVDEATRVAFMTLFQRARENWEGLAEYL